MNDEPKEIFIRCSVEFNTAEVGLALSEYARKKLGLAADVKLTPMLGDDTRDGTLHRVVWHQTSLLA